MSKILIGVMGPGEQATDTDIAQAYQLGQLIASRGWVLVCGGRACGVMEAVSQGAKACDGLTVGILPSDNTSGMSSAIDIPILTGLGHARNVINVLSSQVVVACGLGLGTLSEISLALKAKRPVILMSEAQDLYGFLLAYAPQLVTTAATPDVAIAAIQTWLDTGRFLR